MKKLVLLMCLVASVALVAQQPRRGGRRPRAARSRRIRPDLPSKAPDQGWVGEAWSPHEGGLLRVKVHLRFGVEAPVGVRGKEGAWKPMPAGLVLRPRVDGRQRPAEQRLRPASQRRHRSARGVRRRGQLPAVVGQGRHRRSARHPRRSREQRLGGRSRRRDSEVHDRRQAADDDRHQGRARQRRQVVRQPDRHRLGFAGQHLHRRRLRQQPRGEVRQDRQVRHVVGHARHRARASSARCTRFSSTRRIARM